MRKSDARKVYRLAKDLADDVVLLAEKAKNLQLTSSEVSKQAQEIVDRYRLRVERIKRGCNGEALKSIRDCTGKISAAARAFAAKDTPPEQVAAVLRSIADSLMQQAASLLSAKR
ncbi:hypothetical protein SAMN00808754_1387 [Thermanaeromonas toyohensis ToBE]|uniref:Uncharacterized protein n=1 Tax=Thermanaeromonas toyohensis ToBE TaxID=698762 RepID=A0A1W1VSG5_9FIRM|nr:hypothetical protein [Thermanaeromonas toyohensis]SMB96041.1 hypothetical protein SAMN00808754_1387 [Thermanaeromonas toyohensis ToBE]